MTIPFTPYEQANGTAPTMDVTHRLDVIEDQLAALTERLADLEDAAPAGRKRDDLNERILEFLRQYPGLKFTAFTVAENLGEDNSAVGTRMRTLARNGLITTSQEDGRARVFHVPADPAT